MPRFCLTLVSLLVVLATARGLAQTAEEFSIQRLPLIDRSPQAPRSQAPSPAAGETLIADSPISLDGSAEAPPVTSLRNFQGYRYSVDWTPGGSDSSQAPPSQNPSPAAGEKLLTDAPVSLDGSAEASPVASLRDFQGYRYLTSSLDWIPGNGDEFGMFSLAWDHYQKSGIANGIGVGMGFHFPSGPVQTDMPPRLFNFSIAYQIREQLGPLKFDLAASMLVASDFNACARRGFFFPSHAVGFLSVSPEIDVVFGVDYLDRRDIELLPVAGLIWTPNTKMRFEMVFPRPRAVYQLTDRHRLYLGGELGGGTWSIERANFDDDLVTYRDLRVCIGVEYVETDGRRGGVEVAYLFDRRLEYTSGLGDMNLNDAVMLRLVTRY
jgi:hypothetical protein